MDDDLVSRNELWKSLTANALVSYVIVVISATALFVIGLSTSNYMTSIGQHALLISIITIIWVQWVNGHDLSYGLQSKYSDEAEDRMRQLGHWNKWLHFIGILTYMFGVMITGFGLIYG